MSITYKTQSRQEKSIFKTLCNPLPYVGKYVWITAIGAAGSSISPYKQDTHVSFIRILHRQYKNNGLSSKT